MTPVAPLVALRATSWDAALEETLSSSDHARRLGDLAVHSVHCRVVNIRCGDELIALADDRLDDAPWTVRVPIADLPLSHMRVGDHVEFQGDGLTVRTADAAIRVELDPAVRRIRTAVGAAPSPAALRDARTALAAFAPPVATTAFGRASAPMIAAGIQRMRGEASALLHGAGSDRAVALAAQRLIGLGEGLTPSGDDILTGLAFVAAHPGFGLAPLLAPLSAAVHGGVEATTLLSTVTLRAALSGRARSRLHDLIESIIDGSPARIRADAAETASIGHTSGYDILTGIRLALDLAETSHSRARISTETPEGES